MLQLVVFAQILHKFSPRHHRTPALKTSVLCMRKLHEGRTQNRAKRGQKRDRRGYQNGKRRHEACLCGHRYPSAKRRSGNKEGNTQQGTAITGLPVFLRHGHRVKMSPPRPPVVSPLYCFSKYTRSDFRLIHSPLLTPHTSPLCSISHTLVSHLTPPPCTLQLKRFVILTFSISHSLLLLCARRVSLTQPLPSSPVRF